MPQKVVLKRVGFKSTGMYRCEVTVTVRQRGGYGFQGILAFDVKEFYNRMTVVGKNLIKMYWLYSFITLAHGIFSFASYRKEFPFFAQFFSLRGP